MRNGGEGGEQPIRGVMEEVLDDNVHDDVFIDAIGAATKVGLSFRCIVDDQISAT